MVKNRYIGLSTDQKPVRTPINNVSDGSTFYCTDTSELYIYDSGRWYLQTKGGGSKIEVDSELSETSTNPVQNKVITIALGDKADVKEEHQVIGWTKVDGGFVQLDLRPYIAEGCTKFTILCYVRKGTIRQGIKFELTLSELNKFLSKVTNNVMCITKMCINPSNENESGFLKQCIKKHLENGQPVDNVIEIMHNIYANNAMIPVANLDNFECCMFGE